MSIQDRAGTRIDHRSAERIYGTRHGRQVVRGLLDVRQRLYQAGGHLNDLVYWKLKVISFDKPVFDQIRHRADHIEVIVHDHNRCYRIATTDADRVAVPYDAGAAADCRERIGIPLHWFEVTDVDGNLIAAAGDRL